MLFVNKLIMKSLRDFTLNMADVPALYSGIDIFTAGEADV